MSRPSPKNPLIVILGPTASGKSKLAVKLARRFSGEIISADSRQIYKEMNIGTAKYPLSHKGNKIFVRAMFERASCGVENFSSPYGYHDIPNHLINMVSPDQEFTLAQYKNIAIKTIKDIHKRGKLPILVGGTGLYIWAVIDNLKIPEVKPQPELRQKIEKEIKQKGLEKVYQKLLKLDPGAKFFVEPNNIRRIIRALEICFITKKPFSKQRKKGQPLFNTLQIGLSLPQNILDKKIDQRVEKMIQADLIDEVKKLAKKYSWKLPSMSGIGYREIGQYLRSEIDLEKAKELIKLHTRQYAKRQIGWFKRDKRIHWVRNYQEAEKLIEEFLR
jgi:tRNA dimethylallyltransferase